MMYALEGHLNKFNFSSGGFENGGCKTTYLEHFQEIYQKNAQNPSNSSMVIRNSIHFKVKLDLKRMSFRFERCKNIALLPFYFRFD